MKKTLKLIYTLIPFKLEMFSLLKKVWKPKESVYRHLYFKGIFTVSNSDGLATIYDTDSEHTYSVTVNKNFVALNSKVIETTIETCTLSSSIKQYQLSKIDLIKIDVETHEAEVREGLGPYLTEFKLTLLIEVLNDKVGQKINTLVQGLDYLFFNINENGGIRRVEEITKSDYYNYLLCNKKIAIELGIFQN